ncbi:MAG: glucose-6-phosphate isomerase family protein, partial [Candidatus Bathyarchaeia archaeon]
KSFIESNPSCSHVLMRRSSSSMKSDEPYSARLGGATGISPYRDKDERRLSDLSGSFRDKRVVEEILSKGEDPVIYEVYEVPQASVAGMLNVGGTVIYPGKIGDEYYLTKGHFHKKESTSEVYIGLEGEGIILVQDRKGQVVSLEIGPNVLVYIPPNTAHRSVNTGSGRLVFLAIYPSDAGHDYESIERTGFAKIVVERDGKPAIEDNPNFH